MKNCKKYQKAKYSFILINVLILSACGGSGDSGNISKEYYCDDSIKSIFKDDASTEVISVKQWRKGETFPNGTIETSYFYPDENKFKADLCLVKLRVGEPTAGPADAPSTTAGIGIEIWLPEKNAWNQRIMAVGGTGWTGGEDLDPNKISSNANSGDSPSMSAPNLAGEDGFVTSNTDTGHKANVGAAFGMSPDGSVNEKGWNDASIKALYEQAVKTKVLTTEYYGEKPKFSYFSGASGGGRQAFKIAQSLPEQYDGILAGVPGVSWSRWTIGGVYPSLVVERDLGGIPMTKAQIALMGNAAIASCDVVGGKHLGFILDSESCTYDPSKDAGVLCVPDGGNNTTDACVTKVQATAMNKIWYGITKDGSVPDPAVDTGLSRPSGNHQWFGYPRGSDVSGLVNNTSGALYTDMLAIAMQDATLSVPAFKNATGNGAYGWRNLSYQQLSQAFDKAIEMQDKLSYFNTESADLSGLQKSGTKLLSFAGVNDSVITGYAAKNYHEDVVSKMGGVATVNSFYRQYMFPGIGHSPATNGTTNSSANPPAFQKKQLRGMLMDWVEKGLAPDAVTYGSLTNNGVQVQIPLCALPTRPQYISGDPLVAGSYQCK